MSDQWTDMERRAARLADGQDAEWGALFERHLGEDWPTLLADVRRLRDERDQARKAAEHLAPWYPGTAAGLTLPWQRSIGG